jgi:ElaB/YqjD/DUF883 family membrane-anchored ribosome-binding protein
LNTEVHDEIIATFQQQANQSTKELDAETKDIINSLIQHVTSLHGRRKENDDLPEQIDALRNQLNESLKKLEDETQDATSANAQQIQLLRTDTNTILDEMKNQQQVATKEDIDNLREDLMRVSESHGSQEHHDIAEIQDQLWENIHNLKKRIKEIQNKLNDLNIRVHEIIQENEADKHNGTEKDQEQDSVLSLLKNP